VCFLKKINFLNPGRLNASLINKDDDIPNMFSDMSFGIKSFGAESALKLISLHLVCLNYMTSKLGDRNLLK